MTKRKAVSIVSQYNDKKEHFVRMFTRLILCGKVFSIVFMEEESLDSLSSVLNHLRERHPGPASLTDLNINADYVESIAHQIQSSVGLEG